MKYILAAILAFTFFAIEKGAAQVPSSSPSPIAAPSATPAPEASNAEVPTPAKTPEAQPAPAEVVPVAPEKSAIEKVWDFLSSAGGFVAGFVVVFEIFVRAFPTKNPLSILVPVKHFIDVSVLILGWLSNLLVSLINAANKSENKIEKKKV